MSSELYRQVLGKQWQALAPSVRGAHANHCEITGVFRITHGTGRLAKLLLRRSRLPPPAAATNTRLIIFPDGSGERWERHFDNYGFITQQWPGQRGLLIERFRAWELCFKPRVKDGTLLYEQCGAKLCWGPWRIPMPLVCAPLVTASERPGGTARVLVSVRVTLPLAGLLISYEGHLDLKGQTP